MGWVMRNATTTWLMAGGLGMVIATGLLNPAAAQPELNKIEAKIRQQLKPPDSQPASGPAENLPVAGGAPQATVIETPPPLPQPPQPAPFDNRARPMSTRTYLGITADETSHGGGVHVLRVHPGGPGEKAGLRVGDAILSLGGMRIAQMADLANLLDIYKPGDKVLLEVFRSSGQSEKIELTLGLRPGPAELATAPDGTLPAQPPQFALPPQPQVLVPPPQVIAPPGEGPALTPPQATADQLRIEQLQQRIDRLERRLERLEREQPAKTGGR